MSRPCPSRDRDRCGLNGESSRRRQNGLYTYDRKPKFDPAVIHAIFARKAAIEEEDTTQAE